SSIETALFHGKGVLIVDLIDRKEEIFFSEHRSCYHCKISFPELTPQHFSFNSPIGFCENCNGLGFHLEPDVSKVVEDPEIPILEGGIRATIGDEGSYSHTYFAKALKELKINGKKTFNELTDVEQKVVLFGSRGFEGVLNTLKRRYNQTESEEAKVYYEKFFIQKKCSVCDGTKLNINSRNVFITGNIERTLPLTPSLYQSEGELKDKRNIKSLMNSGFQPAEDIKNEKNSLVEKNIVEISEMSIEDCYSFFKNLELKGNDKVIAFELIKEISNRLSFLVNVGLDYLSLSRNASTLSGGESQRIRLASQIGSELTNVIYILDEPSIGLHQRDNNRLISTLKKLRDKDNSVIVIEHDRDTMLEADHIIDIGPGAGVHGGSVIFEGSVNEILKTETDTGEYLSGKKNISIGEKRRESLKSFTIKGVNANNISNIDVTLPLGVLVLITGVSGAGKSTLIHQVLSPLISYELGNSKNRPQTYNSIDNLKESGIKKVIEINQSPIGRTPRSNPATYTKLFDYIRAFYAELPESKKRGYKAGRFSFNVKGGRCEACEGDGYKKVEMHFLPDVYVPCEVCKGKRFNDATLEVYYKNRNISDILDTTVSEAVELFSFHTGITRVLQTLDDVGLGYIKLGQSSTTLSGGEAQRIKLAKELSKRGDNETIYILDEPSTGLHFSDIDKLMKVIARLVDRGSSVFMIEHNLDIIKNADYIIDMGPEGGRKGGKVIFSGTPEEIVKEKNSYTGQFLKDYL
ncbi:excinuclease ABC subunit UvrA, partial [bacterium]|nr:excinuclease ABC subunit UvrA [bacterium]